MCISWRRERLPTPVFWPGEFHGLYSPWGHKEWDMTERLLLSLTKCQLLTAESVPYQYRDHLMINKDGFQ